MAIVTQKKEAAYRHYPAAATWLRGVDVNHRPLGYEPNELPGCSTPHIHDNNEHRRWSNFLQTVSVASTVVSANMPICIATTPNGRIVGYEKICTSHDFHLGLWNGAL